MQIRVRVGLEGQHEDVAHQAACARRCPGEFRRRGAGCSAFQGSAGSLAARRGCRACSIRCSTSRTESRYSSSLRWSLELTARRKSRASESTASSTLLSPRSGFVPKEAVERQRRIELQRCRRRGRGPRDVRAIEHRVVLVHRRIGLLARQDQAGNLGRPAVACAQQLVEAHAGTDLAAGGQRSAREQVAGLRAVDVALEGLGVVEPADEQHLLAKLGERGQHLAELHASPAAVRPPFTAVKAVAREKNRQAYRRRARQFDLLWQRRPRLAATPSRGAPSSHRRPAARHGAKRYVRSSLTSRPEYLQVSRPVAYCHGIGLLLHEGLASLPRISRN